MNTQPVVDLNQMYAQLNTQFFDGKLPKIPCVWNGRLTRSLGRTKYKRKNKSSKWKVFLIDIQRGITDQHLHKTMVHEMCHVWAIHYFQETGHGDVFWRKMTACGYPDGHTFGEGVEIDKWQRIDRTEWRLQQKVSFDSEGTQWMGRVIRINKRTITVKTSQPKVERWRVPPQMLRPNW